MARCHSGQYSYDEEEIITSSEMQRNLHSSVVSEFEDPNIECYAMFVARIRQPKVPDVNTVTNEITNSEIMYTGHLPELTEEQSSSIDDDITIERIRFSTFVYLRHIMFHDREPATDDNNQESDGEIGVAVYCQHLNIVLQYWHYLMKNYPNMKRSSLWGQVVCYCAQCCPDAVPQLTGWVRIERLQETSKSEMPVSKFYWSLPEPMLSITMNNETDTDSYTRPTELSNNPIVLSTIPWYDKEQKPHHTVVALEITGDLENDPVNDKLVACLIHLDSQ